MRSTLSPSRSRFRRRGGHLCFALLLCGTLARAAAPTIQAFQNRAGAASAVAGDVGDLTGTALATGTASATAYPLPFSLATTQVFCNNYPAPILSVAPGKLRIQLPWELAGLQSAQVRVISSGVASAGFTLPLAEFAPTILALDAASVTYGQTLNLRVIGLGPRDRNPATGAGPASDSPGPAFVHFLVWIGGVPAPVTVNLLAAGDVQNNAGVQNVAVQVPFNVAAGDGVGVQVQIGGILSDPLPVSVQAAPVQISLSPTSVQVPLQAIRKFASSVLGSADTALTWSFDTKAYPNSNGSYGRIQDGMYVAADNMTAPSWVIVRATHSSGAFATALIQLVAASGNSYRIVPDSPVISLGDSISLSLVDAGGNTVDGVNWLISDGYGVTYTNTYSAPAIFTPLQVVAWARLPGAYGYAYDVATTTILVDPPHLQITGSTPAVGHIGEPIAFQTSGGSTQAQYAWFTAADGSRIRTAGQFPITVPHGAVSGPVWVEIIGAKGGADFLSSPYNLTILPRLRLHAARQRVSSGEAVQVAAPAPDIPGQWPLTWKADLGSVDAKGLFVAPPVTQTAFARIWACLQQNNECGTTVVEIVPLRLDPDPVILNPGETAQLNAWRGSAAVPATWSAVTANLTITPAGKVTAGNGAFDGGVAAVTAAYAGVTQTLYLSIRSPGSVSNTAEYDDWLGTDGDSPTGRLALGTFDSQMAINGNWMYVLARSEPYGNYSSPWLAKWLDVYQLDARRNPVWVDSVEAPYSNGIDQTSLYLEGNNLYALGREGGLSATDNTLVRFDVSAGRPVVVGRQSFDGSPSTYRHQGRAVTLASDPNRTDQVTLQIQDFAAGSTRLLPVDYVPLGGYTATIAASPTWAAIGFYYAFAYGEQYETVVFDITGATAEPIAVLPSGGFEFSLTALQDVLVAGGDVYKVSGGKVTLASQMAATFVLDSDPATKRLLMEPFYGVQTDGYRVVDLSDAAHPKISATTVHSNPQSYGKLGPDYIALLGGPQQVAIYPTLYQNGIRQTDSYPALPWMNDVRVRSGYAYWTGPGWGLPGRSESFGVFQVTDLSTSPATLIASLNLPGDQIGWAIELNGHFAYVGTDTELAVYDITNPANPIQGTVIKAPAISMALLGNYLYVGSNSAKDTLLLVYDLSNPATPKLVSTLRVPDFPYGLTAQSGWLAAALGKSGIYVYSLANPAAPTLSSQWSGTFWDVDGSTSLLYAAADASGLLVYNMANLKSPALLSSSSLAAGDERRPLNFPNALALSFDPQGIVWVCSDKDGRIYGLDVRQPAFPRHVAEIVTQSGAAHTRVDGTYLYVAGNDAALDIRSPQNVGLYNVDQSAPGQVLPDRYSATAPVSQSLPGSGESLKSRILHGRENKGDSVIDREHPRAFRSLQPRNEPRNQRKQR